MSKRKQPQYQSSNPNKPYYCGPKPSPSAPIDAKQILSFLSSLFWIGLFIVAVVGLRSAMQKDPQPDTNHHSGDGNGSSEGTTDERAVAWVTAQHAILADLKSPSSADFPWFDHTFSKNGDHYVISSHVDAQNAFGAKLRRNFSVNLTSSDGKNFSVDYVQWDDGISH